MAMLSAHMQCLLGLQCHDFVMIAADQTNTQSIIVMNNDQNKIHQINEKLIMGIVGDAADSAQLSQFVAKNLQLYKMRNRYSLDAPAIVHFTRKNLADGLRNSNPLMINLLIGGHDDINGGQLCSLDFLASCVKVPYAAHGFGGLFSMGILDQLHKYVTTEADAYEVMKICIHEIQLRLFISLPNFQVKVVSRDGIKEYPTINAATFLSSSLPPNE